MAEILPPPLTAKLDIARAAELGVTATEAKHLQQLASGWTHAEIAASAWITPNAAGTRLWRLWSRLGLRSSQQLIAWAYENRVLVVPRA
jgi:DNA-binding CsgD family transcriptional regulator